MRLQYRANYRLLLYYRRVLMELARKMELVWTEERQFIGCSSLESVFTIECRENQQEAIERRLLIKVPVYSPELWPEPYPEEYINIAGMLSSGQVAFGLPRRPD